MLISTHRKRTFRVGLQQWCTYIQGRNQLIWRGAEWFAIFCFAWQVEQFLALSNSWKLAITRRLFKRCHRTTWTFVKLIQNDQMKLGNNNGIGLYVGRVHQISSQLKYQLVPKNWTPLYHQKTNCKRPAEQRLHWERKEKRIPGQSITSSIVKSLSEASFGLMGWGEVKPPEDQLQRRISDSHRTFMHVWLKPFTLHR